MKKLFGAMAVTLSLVLPGHAAEPDPRSSHALPSVAPKAADAAHEARVRRAVARLVEAQHFDQLWPAITDSMVAQGTDQLERLARQEVDKIAGLSLEQRAQGHARVAQIMTLMKAEMKAVYLGVDVVSLNNEAGYAAYGTHCTVAEIEALADYYSSAPFQHWLRLQIDMKNEIARSGQSEEQLWPTFAAKLSASDREGLRAFADSALGDRETAVGPFLKKSASEVFKKHINGATGALADKHGLALRAVLQDLKKQG